MQEKQTEQKVNDPIVEELTVVLEKNEPVVISDQIRPSEILIKHDGTYQWRRPETVTLEFLDEHGDKILDPVFDRFGLVATLGDIIITDNVITTQRVQNGEVALEILPVSEGRNIVLQTIGIDGLSEPLMYTQ